MELKINEAAKLSGVTVRTLHYYDEIGLLKPSRVTESGYRMYDEKALDTLQQILFFRELDFPLKDICKIMANPAYSRTAALQKQRELLVQERNRLSRLIALTEQAIKGENTMDFEAFDKTDIEANRKQYAEEVRERWGDTEAYDECEKKTSSYSHQQWDFLNGKGAKLLKAFGESRMLEPKSEIAQKLVQQWQAYITENFYRCTNQILRGLGQMYVADERFTKSIDQYGSGTAAFMAEAIAYYCVAK